MYQKDTSMTKIEFRCTKEERKKIEEKASKAGLCTGKYLMKNTIYKRSRSGLSAAEKACICRIGTCLNQIKDGISSEANTQKIFKECELLCQSLK